MMLCSSRGLSTSTRSANSRGTNVAEAAGSTDSAQRSGHDPDEHAHRAGTTSAHPKVAAGAETVSQKQGCSYPNTRDCSPDRFTGPVLSANRHLGTTDGCWPGLPRCDSSSGRPYEWDHLHTCSKPVQNTSRTFYGPTGQLYQHADRRAQVWSSTTWAWIVHGDKHQHSSNRFMFVPRALGLTQRQEPAMRTIHVRRRLQHWPSRMTCTSARNIWRHRWPAASELEAFMSQVSSC